MKNSHMCIDKGEREREGVEAGRPENAFQRACLSSSGFIVCPCVVEPIPKAGPGFVAASATLHAASRVAHAASLNANPERRSLNFR